MIYDKNNDKFEVLEFSPRIVGGRIAKMIKYASGIDLEKISMMYFFEEKPVEIKENINKATIVDICNVNSEGKEISGYNGKELSGFRLIDVEETKSSIGENKVRYKIYEKESDNNDNN